MIVNFEIESIFKITNRGYFIAAKCLDKDAPFQMSEKAYLGQVKILNWFDIPRVLDESGNPRFDVFCFQIQNEDDKDILKLGEIVDLKT
jgi:hypothetical protein